MSGFPVRNEIQLSLVVDILSSGQKQKNKQTNKEKIKLLSVENFLDWILSHP